MALRHDTSTPAIEVTNRILDQLTFDFVKEIYAGQWAELDTARGVYELGAALHQQFKEEVESDSNDTRCRDRVFGDRGELRFLLGLDDEGNLIPRPKGGPRIAEVIIPNTLNSTGNRRTTKSLVRLYAMGKIDLDAVQRTVYHTLDLIQDNWELLNKASREEDFAFDADKFKAFRERCVIQVVGVGYMPQGEQIEFQIPGPVFKR